jgi:hypothetical protein
MTQNRDSYHESRPIGSYIRYRAESEADCAQGLRYFDCPLKNNQGRKDQCDDSEEGDRTDGQHAFSVLGLALRSAVIGFRIAD